MLGLILAAALAQAPAAADAAKPADAKPALSIGSKAPVPDVEQFLRGDKPAFFEPGKVYVLEFWATWCGPCRQSMPHLTKLAEDLKDKGVVVVGISDEKPETVQRFLDKDEWKQKARYVIGTDPDRSTQRDYMEAAGQTGIPTAFIVKEGVVQWIGHPMQVDEPLSKVVDGTWDVQAAKTTFDDAVAEEMRAMGKRNAMVKALEAKDWDALVRMIDAELASAKGEEQVTWKAQKAQILLMAGRGDAGYALCEEVAKQDPGSRIMLAITVLRMPEIQDRRVDVAIGWLEAQLKDGSDPLQPALLSELGYAWSLKKDWAKATDFGKRAIDSARSLGPVAADYVAELEAQLKDFESRAAGEAKGAPAAGTP
jgi:thiol-disulfide isomerase/thioredoxin